MNCGVGCRLGSDPALLRLWHRPVATALIRPLAQEPPYVPGVALEKTKKKKRQKHISIMLCRHHHNLFPNVFIIPYRNSRQAISHFLLTLAHGKHCFPLCLNFPASSNKCNYVILVLLSFAYFTLHNVFKFHPDWSTNQNFKFQPFRSYCLLSISTLLSNRHFHT